MNKDKFSEIYIGSCSLNWMLHSRQNNKKIKHLHKRYLQFIQNDKLPSSEELLEKVSQSLFITETSKILL